jgi:hypothetical protein
MSTLSSEGYLEPQWEGSIVSRTPDCPLVARFCLTILPDLDAFLACSPVRHLTSVA